MELKDQKMKVLRHVLALCGCLVLSVLLLALIAYVYRGEIELRYSEWMGGILLWRDDETTLPPFDVEDYSKVKMWRLNSGVKVDWLDLSSDDRDVVREWLESEHKDAIPSFCDYVPRYVVMFENDEENSYLRLTMLIDVDVIVYDICKNGQCSQYVRAGSSRDRRFFDVIRRVTR